jgi:plasmid stabilization system protein ParE
LRRATASIGKVKIKGAIERLGRHPYSARPIERLGIRVLAVLRYPYLVFYTVDENAREVHILRIRHSSQDTARHLD